MPPKRKTPSQADDEVQPRRSTRQRTSTAPAPAATPEKKLAPVKKSNKTGGKVQSAGGSTAAGPKTGPSGEEEEQTDGQGRQYWLMKAEPETRFENGVDVRFSIDDLAARSEPEPWDGIRNYVARNNLRAMKKGDLAFFYHSNCKEPGIVGTMEIVQEHSPDLTAHDPKCPYYDPKSKPDDPKWSVVHVEFRSKFRVPIGLKELRAMGGGDGPLRDMQMLKQSRLSVSRVSAEEWGCLVGVAEAKARDKAEAGA
ncbi:hypothetical protein KVR01_013818 [Diaporthe batatas]|uniref:uncharacterized protein n=1 Tax=Diaporthe batatas TaxID=748121 RepID=UPI001D047473|nr:uncharacterized protein KVR01_013818 [Diaporthe batatas]KAG8156366.1 hypothetical protein KVR01_013818 [Diaporthe batatas]